MERLNFRNIKPIEKPAYLTREIPLNCPNNELCIRLRESNTRLLSNAEFAQLMNDAQTMADVDQQYKDCWEAQKDEYSCFMRTEARRLWMVFK